MPFTHHTGQTRKRISKTMTGRKKTIQHIENIASANRGKKRTEEQNIANSERGKEYFQNPINRETLSNTIRSKFKNDPEYRGKVINGNRNRDKSCIQKLSDSAANLWKDQQYVKRQRVSRALRPNKPEKLILELLDSMCPNEWKYTGDFSFTINGKNPDFVNCNGQKKIIELFGDYWHQGDNPQDRIDAFKPFGYETLVIWESELKDIDAVTRRIKLFCEDIC